LVLELVDLVDLEVESA